MHSPFRPHSQLQNSSHSNNNNSEDASDWSLPYTTSISRPPSASQSIDSPAATPQDPPPPLPSYLTRSSSDSDETPYSESSPPRPFSRLPKSSPLPDPSQFPDPYPFRTPQYLSSGPPTLSSGGSSIASTRSSAAYTSSGSALASGDFGNHVHIASNDEEQAIGVGITSDDVVHLTNQDSSMSTSVSQSRAPIDQTRWSQSYSASIRSRSSLVRSNSSSGHENSALCLQQKPCDLSWQPVDERDEVELISDVDTEDTDLDVDDLPEVEGEEERTSAIVIAEEGRGLIVRGDGMAVADLVVQPGEVACPSPLFFALLFPSLILIRLPHRHYSFTHRVIKYGERFASIFDFCPPNHQHYLIGSGYFRQFSWRSSSGFGILLFLRRTKRFLQPTSCSSSFHSEFDIPSRSHSGFDWHYYPSCAFKCAGQAAYPEYTKK